MLSDPREQLVIPATVFFQQTDQKLMGRIGVAHEAIAIHPEEHVGGEERYAFVLVYEGMVHDERLGQGRCHFGQVALVARSRSVESALEQAEIPDPGGPTEALDQGRVNG